MNSILNDASQGRTHLMRVGNQTRALGWGNKYDIAFVNGRHLEGWFEDLTKLFPEHRWSLARQYRFNIRKLMRMEYCESPQIPATSTRRYSLLTKVGPNFDPLHPRGPHFSRGVQIPGHEQHWEMGKSVLGCTEAYLCTLLSKYIAMQTSILDSPCILKKKAYFSGGTCRRKWNLVLSLNLTLRLSSIMVS